MHICTFASGSRGNCALVSMNGRNFLIDAGISMKRICENLSACSLKPADIDGILITHHHSDHICGLGMFTKHHRVPVFAPRTTAAYLRMSMKCAPELIHVFPVGSSMSLDGLCISSFATSHDTEESAGYRFEGDMSFAFATDTGTVTESVLGGLRGADAVIIESNHDLQMLRYGSYPYPLKQRILSHRGHLSNDDCGQLACALADSGTEYIVLAHLSRENNTPAKAFETVRNALGEREIRLFVAPEAERLSIELGAGL